LQRETAHASGDPWFFFQPFLAADNDLNQEEKVVIQRTAKAGVGAEEAQLLVLGEESI